MDVGEANNKLPVIHNLSFDKEEIDNGAVFTITNNRDYPAESVAGLATFLLD